MAPETKAGPCTRSQRSPSQNGSLQWAATGPDTIEGYSVGHQHPLQVDTGEVAIAAGLRGHDADVPERPRRGIALSNTPTDSDKSDKKALADHLSTTLDPGDEDL